MGSATTTLARTPEDGWLTGEISPGAGATKISKLRIVSLRMAWCDGAVPLARVSPAENES
jgi:hypothetical protein